MADLIIPSGYAQVQLRWRVAQYDSGGASTSFGVAIPDNDLLGQAEFWADQWRDHLKPEQDDDVTLSEVAVLTADEGAVVAVEEAGQKGGFPVVAPNTCVLIRLATARRGRRGRGRMYPPGFAFEVQVNDSGNLVPAYQDDLTGFFNGFFDQSSVTAPEIVVLQRTTPTGPGAPANPTPPISPPPLVTSIVCDGKVATQRRRLRR